MSPRLSRSQLATYTYFHICARGNNRQDIFLDNKDRLRYLSVFEKCRLRFALQCFAYCLMSNHIHLLCRAPSIRTLSKAMHTTHVSYVMYFNRRHNRSGHLFQDRFTSWVIKDEHHLFEAKDYIENNPVKAGLTRIKERFEWSSASTETVLI
ncbi:MAG: transposase [Candidatus Omnitrophica bacterium]|nr:transposase [Candidatus Omnitrophota bacterium]